MSAAGSLGHTPKLSVFRLIHTLDRFGVNPCTQAKMQEWLRCFSSYTTGILFRPCVCLTTIQLYILSQKYHQFSVRSCSLCLRIHIIYITDEHHQNLIYPNNTSVVVLARDDFCVLYGSRSLAGPLEVCWGRQLAPVVTENCICMRLAGSYERIDVGNL